MKNVKTVRDLLFTTKATPHVITHFSFLVTLFLYFTQFLKFCKFHSGFPFHILECCFLPADAYLTGREYFPRFLDTNFFFSGDLCIFVCLGRVFPSRCKRAVNTLPFFSLSLKLYWGSFQSSCYQYLFRLQCLYRSTETAEQIKACLIFVKTNSLTNREI